MIAKLPVLTPSNRQLTMPSQLAKSKAEISMRRDGHDPLAVRDMALPNISAVQVLNILKIVFDLNLKDCF